MNELNKLCDKLLSSYRKDADPVPEGFFTMRQIAQGMKKSIPTAGRVIHAETERGNIETAVFRIDTTRGVYPVKHYRYVGTK